MLDVLSSCASPLRGRANLATQGEPYRDLLVHMYTDFDQRQTLLN